MVLHLENLQQFINRNSTQKEDHKIWNQSIQNVLTMTSFYQKVGLSKNNYQPYELFWIIENQKEMDPNTRLEKRCNITNCISHYKPIQYNLDSIVEMDVNTYIKVCERFDKYCEIDIETNCINWIGFIDVSGYGKFGFLGGNCKAHRVAYMLSNCEDIPEGQVVRHLCPIKNTRCVNPDHLTVGTYQQNSQDAVDAGNIPQGEKNPNSTISNEVAQMIIDSFRNKKTAKERAKEFGVSGYIIRSIDKATSWRSLMTSEQIFERESVERRQITTEVLSDDIIQKIKSSLESFGKCAKTYNTTKGIVQRIREGKYKSVSQRDKIVFNETIARLLKNSTKFKDAYGVEHLLFKNDKSQDSNAKRYKISYFNNCVGVNRASYMAHHKIKSIEQGKMVRHKCLYKHCISNECLELGTAQDNTNDRNRDNTNKKGEQNPQCKITQQLATNIKQTKGIGTTQQRSEFFNVKIGIIDSIDNQKAWAHIEDNKIDQEVIDKLELYVISQPMSKRARLI